MRTWFERLAVMSFVISNAVACSAKSTLSSDLTVGASSSAKSAEAISGSKQLLDQKISKETKFKGVQGFLVKDSERLRNTINECLDAGLLSIKASMITAAAADAAAGRKVILGQTFSGALTSGKDIVEVLAADLYDPLLVARTDTSAGTLTLDYLGALATVADVVAWNCDFANPSARCNCGAPDGAKKILQRCIPSYSDAQIDNVAKVFASRCSGDLASKRAALASFLSSSTFAEAR
ncbi:hypothetical protein EBU99_12810 [bacterium]|nr:hypothetical protein [bacterium]